MRRASGENFPVASRVLPREARHALLSLYGYARLVDEIGDTYEGDRLGALDWVENTLLTAVDGEADAAHPLLAGAAALVKEGRVSRQPLLDLIEANRMDQINRSYATAEDLYRYCALSANPVGRLVLEVFGVLTPERAAWSDSVCTGLQLVEHWQDVAEDARSGRVYLPLEDLERFGVDVAELISTGPASSRLRALIAFEACRTRDLLDAGRPLVASVRGRLRFALAGFVAGGNAALDAIAARGNDPLLGPPKPSATAVARHMSVALRGRSDRGARR
jgi:squalene synthase HpnC